MKQGDERMSAKTAMRHGKNVWVSFYGDEYIKSATRPAPKGEDFFVPAIPASRYTKNGYIPYNPGSEWERLANKTMAKASRP
jgi:hypothetical protein